MREPAISKMILCREVRPYLSVERMPARLSRCFMILNSRMAVANCKRVGKGNRCLLPSMPKYR